MRICRTFGAVWVFYLIQGRRASRLPLATLCRAFGAGAAGDVVSPARRYASHRAARSPPAYVSPAYLNR
ncbi:MAG TPA: hypothetical protein VFZ71_12940 [Pyrinomonadaceae bacterium]